VPLYRYQMRLRLNRALVELPHCNDITGLALELGFSSHSHFTAVFGKAFGLTPSDYRSISQLLGETSMSVLAVRPRFYPRRAA
jgi:AraC family transcriptional regulator